MTTSVAQRLENLSHAQKVNRARADYKAELKSGKARLSWLLRDGVPDWLGSMRAEHLLRLAPRVGTSAVASLLAEANLGPMQEARHITVRQLNLLADELEKIENLRRARSHRTLSGTRRRIGGVS